MQMERLIVLILPPRLDKVQIHIPIPPGSDLSLLGSIHQDVAKKFGTKSQYCSNKKGSRRYLRLHLSTGILEVEIRRQYGNRWLMYRFNGPIDFGEADEAALPFGDYDFENGLMTGHIKALEFAQDISGAQAKDFLVHLVGTSVSHIAYNADKTGQTKYVGSRDSALQFVMYDKAQELRDKKKPCAFKNLMRVELRVINRKESFPYVVARLIDDCVFDKLRVVSLAQAMDFKSPVADWKLFLSACQLEGVPVALAQFKHHKKTFLKYIHQLSKPLMQPKIESFQEQICALLPWAPFNKLLDAAFKAAG